MMVFVGGAFWKRSGHEGEAFMNTISAPIRRKSRKRVTFSQPCEVTVERKPPTNQEGGFQCSLNPLTP